MVYSPCEPCDVIFLVVPTAVVVLRVLVLNSLVHHDPYGFEMLDVLPWQDIAVLEDTVLELVVVATVQGVLNVETECAPESFDNGPIVLEQVILCCEKGRSMGCRSWYNFCVPIWGLGRRNILEARCRKVSCSFLYLRK